MNTNIKRRTNDVGFSLVETLVAVVVTGIVVASVCSALVTSMKAMPHAEERSATARSRLGINAFLPADVNSTAPGDFVFDKSVDTSQAGCLGASENNLVQMNWKKTAATTMWVAYRFEKYGAAAGPSITRTTCVGDAKPVVHNLTSPLEQRPVVEPRHQKGKTIGFLMKVADRAKTLSTEHAKFQLLAITSRADYPTGFKPKPIEQSAELPVRSKFSSQLLRLTTSDGGGFVQRFLPFERHSVDLWPGKPLPAGKTLTFSTTKPLPAGVRLVVPWKVSVTEQRAIRFDDSVHESMHGVSRVDVELPKEADGRYRNVGRHIDVSIEDPNIGDFEINYEVTDEEGNTLAGVAKVTPDRCEVKDMVEGGNITHIPVPRLRHKLSVFGSFIIDSLVGSVTYTVETNGNCDDLVLEFRPQGPGSPPQYAPFKQATVLPTDTKYGITRMSATIPDNEHVWSLGTHQVRLRNGKDRPAMYPDGIHIISVGGL